MRPRTRPSTSKPVRERWDREDSAPRLRDEVPNLTRLTLELTESSGTVGGLMRHVRHVQVQTAAAHFEVPCANADCEMGGHDLTRAIMGGLRSGKTTIEGSSSCPGAHGTVACNRVLTFVANAEYGEPAKRER